MKRLLVFLLLLLSVGLPASAQTGGVATGNFVDESGKQYVGIKWISPSIINPKGVNIFRRYSEADSWKKINHEPVVMGKFTISEAILAQDEELEGYKSLVDNVGKKEGGMDGFLGLALGTKAILNEPFAWYIGIRYNDREIEKGKSYQYKVEELNGNLIGVSIEIVVSNTFLVAPPEDIQMKQKKKVVQLNYKPEPHRFFAVNIYRAKKGAEFEKLNEKPVMIITQRDENGEVLYPDYFYEDASVEAGTAYLYKLKAIDFFGREGEASDDIPFFVKDLTKPMAPELSALSAENQQVNLSWQYEGKDIKEFEVWRSPYIDSAYAKVNESALLSKERNFTDNVKAPGVWFYKLRAVNYLDNFSESSVVMVAVKDLFPPLKPQGLKASAEPGIVSLQWVANAETDLEGYYVYQSVNKGQNFERLNQDALKQTTFEVNLPNNVKNELLFKVVAADVSGNKSEGSEFVSATMPDKTAPPKPFLKQVVNHENTVVIEWLPVLDEDVAGYQVYRKMKGSADFEKLNITKILLNSSKYTDRRAEPGQEYEYVVMAEDGEGNVSGPSNSYQLKVSRKEQDLSKMLEAFEGLNMKKGKGVELRWKIQNPESVKGYIIYRRFQNEAIVPLTGLIAANSFQDQDLNTAGSYTYQLRIYPKQGKPVLSEFVTINIEK